MKKIFLAVPILVLMATLAFSATLNIRATWTPNTEGDMAGYNLYRTDGSRVKINSVLIPHPPTLPYAFSVTVPDASSGTLTFVLTAVDTSGNESADSNTASYSYDFVAPGAPKALRVTQ